MNENELIALERVAISARKLLEAVATNPNLFGAGLKRELANLGQDIGLLDTMRKTTPLPTAKEVILKVLNEWNLELVANEDDSDRYLPVAGDIHQALVKAGYL